MEDDDDDDVSDLELHLTKEYDPIEVETSITLVRTEMKQIMSY